MNIIERFSGVFLIAGIFLFSGATISLGLVPAFMVDKVHPRQGLPEVVPENMKEFYASTVDYQNALLRGRDLYIREGCWHCHSQYVRPVANENLYYGPVSTPAEYQTALHLPQLLGTRRVGPDLSREAGKKSNDWHFAHLYNPTSVVPESIMPSYTWYFKKDEAGVPQPTDDAKAIVAYLQNLGAEVADRHEGPWDMNVISLPPHE
jgi:cbb3-type cytochrome c oxidase subunit II